MGDKDLCIEIDGATVVNAGETANWYIYESQDSQGRVLGRVGFPRRPIIGATAFEALLAHDREESAQFAH